MLSFGATEATTSVSIALTMCPQALECSTGARLASIPSTSSVEHAAMLSRGGEDCIRGVVQSADESLSTRSELAAFLRGQRFLDREDPRFFHGRMCPIDLPVPTTVWKSDCKPRDGSASWITATEFE